MSPNHIDLSGVGSTDVTKPYKIPRKFGAMDVPKPCKFIGFGTGCAENMKKNSVLGDPLGVCGTGWAHQTL